MKWSEDLITGPPWCLSAVWSPCFKTDNEVVLCSALFSLLSRGTIPPVSGFIEICSVFSHITGQWLLASPLLLLGQMNILYIGDSLQWDSQIWLHSSCGSPQSLICHLLPPPAPEVHCEERLQESGVLCDNPGLSCHSCPSQTLFFSNCIPFRFCLDWLLLVFASPGMCVFLGQKVKRTTGKGKAPCPPPPWFCPHLPTGHLPSLWEGTWPFRTALQRSWKELSASQIIWDEKLLYLFIF